MSARLGLGLLLLVAPETVQADEKPKEPVRVLLVAGAPSREYQAVRMLLLRAVAEKRAELSVYLQPAVGADGVEHVDQGVPKERLLKSFPDRLNKEDTDPERKFYDLGAYDVVIAFDPDWSRITAEQTGLLKKWVEDKKGGLVFIAGPLNSYQLAAPKDADKTKPVRDLLPVIVADSRIALERKADTPFALTFPGKPAMFPFLAVGEDGDKPLEFWERFFDAKAEPGRGFYSCHPVKSLKSAAVVVACCNDPGLKMKDGAETPYIATVQAGKGRVVYLGSAEMWRITRASEHAHERFWTKLIANAAQK
jgi:hypothetical protein